MNEVEKLSEEMLRTAFELDASDIHLIPRKSDTLIEFRIHDHLYEYDLMAKPIADRLISYYKFRAGMDIGERRRPQSGSYDIVIHEHKINLRFSTLPTPYDESLVIRLLPQIWNTRLSDLSIFSESTAQLSQLLNFENGLILFSGPTGSGKTTTMYTMLHSAKRRYNCRIVTLEDPIEKLNENFIQMEINEKADLTYQTGFKAILRHDPDIIMVGEIRDLETAKIAVRAALTGHLVLSTVHATNAVLTIHRLIELGLSKFDLKETLVGVVAQRLVTLHCPRCGNVCEENCPNRLKMKRRRTAIFEILTGLPLLDALQDKKPSLGRYKRLEDYYRQISALGYLDPQRLAPGADHVPS
ncbi:competence type IV pilus ATPase ComGA [Tuberibacillus calidus]|uniref:competence type IV pilus ATPase ComGA n=1 Tax=Tuberibacillus calidus TaxID=340097 RepID=UPI0004118B17|nr:competence type IV pilus ATPase ComGA [Tuberibacillus calidus]